MKTRRKGASLLLALVMVFALALSGCGQNADDVTIPQSDTQVDVNVFAGGSGTAEDPYQIATAEQLDKVRENLTASYVLTVDIDLSSYDNFEPIGQMVAVSPDEPEIPDPSAAFSGTFDGNGKTISNLNLNTSAEMRMGTGLFGVVVGADSDSPAVIKNLTITNVDIRGFCLVGAAVGLQGDNSTVQNVKLTGEGNTIFGCEGVGGVVGTGAVGSNYFIEGCEATVDITVDPVDMGEYGVYPAATSGIVVGGLSGGSMKDCKAINSTITATGDNVYGIGGVVGAPYNTTALTNCDASDVTINVIGENPVQIGGIAGFAGTYGELSAAEISDCDAEGVSIEVSDTATLVGGIVGGSRDGALGTSEEGIASIFIVDDASSSDAADSIVGGDEHLEALTNTYQQLFEGATFNADCDSYWHDAAAAIVGESGADQAVELMKTSIGGSIYGQEAIDAYSGDLENAQFACGFIGGVSTLKFDGTQISGFDANGKEVFSGDYQCIGYLGIGKEMGIEGFGGYIYKSLESESGEFTYFIILPDTPDSTYHIELRYGSDLDALQKYAEGDYAYWLAAGIPTSALTETSPDKGANDAMLRNVIGLFCAENLSSMTTDDTAAQRDGLVGIWDADAATIDILRSETGLPNANMYMELKADGSGATYVDMDGSGNYTMSGEYTFYAYDNDGDETALSGWYIAVPDESSDSAPYDIVMREEKTVISFYAADGTASWVKR